MRQASRDLLEAMAVTLDTSVQEALTFLKGGSDPRSSNVPPREFAILRQSLRTDAEIEAFERVLRNALAATLHGIGVILDGGTNLSDEYDVRLTLNGEEPEPGLHELIIAYLDETGRAP